MGKFSWADMVLGMLDADIYIKNDFLLRSVRMVMVVKLVVGSMSLGGARARLRALSQVCNRCSSLSTFIAANSCLMVMDYCGTTTR